MPNLLEELKNIRKNYGHTQLRLANSLGVPQSYIAKLENQKLDPRLSTVIEVARTLGYELMLVPKPLISLIDAHKNDQDLSAPRWQPDEALSDD